MSNLPQTYLDESVSHDISQVAMRNNVPLKDYAADTQYWPGGDTSRAPMRQGPQVHDPITPLLFGILKKVLI